ncbi:CRE-ITX-1 protein [Aphelenchoides avenae]|nr:CRE-ITX-1 protein [Aphelenchus avenae]
MRRTKAELPRIWRLISLFLLFAVSLIADEKEYPPFTTHLDADDSSVEFRSWLWMLEGLHPDGRFAPEFHIHLRYRTFSPKGRLLTAVAENKDGKDVFILTVDLLQGKLKFELSDTEGNLLSHGGDDKAAVNDGAFHELLVTISGNQTAIDVNQERFAIKKSPLMASQAADDLDVRITLGQLRIYYDPTPSIIGCVSLVNVGEKERIHLPETVHEIKVSGCPEEEPILAAKPTDEAPEGEEDDDDENPNVKYMKEQGFLRPDGSLPIVDEIEKIGDGATPSKKKPSSDIPLELSCRPSERTLCENAKNCVRYRNKTEATCVCKPGYGGKYCQFSLFPRNCYDAFAHGDAETGVYEIDVDRSGPLLATFVECRKNGVTSIANNVPPRAVIRSSEDTSSKFYPVTYKLFSEAQLRALMRRSERCEQSIRYECFGAPLDFAKNMTWFDTVSGRRMNRIGPTENACYCRDRYGCSGDRACNCDDPNQTDVDEGVISGEDAGITAIYVHRHHPEGSGRITLGPLECSGDAGHAESAALTFKSRSARVSVAIKKTWTSFEFDFRTNQPDVEYLLSGFIDGNGAEFHIGLSTGHRLAMTLKDDTSEPRILSILSQSPLNDLKWHRIIVEVLRGEVRLSVDRLNVFAEYDFNAPATTFVFGSAIQQEDGSGFIGCVRNFYVDSELYNLASFITQQEVQMPPLFSEGCPDLCGGHSCEQDSKCIEHFETMTTSCECLNRFIHFGDRCEKNVNRNSEVSFHDSTIGYLKFLDEHLEENPLNSNIVFSVRTDQKRALFVYAHDHFDNFIQVHLPDEYRIVLTLNNETDVRSCTVYSSKGKEFSDMRWLQIVVEQTPNRVTLSVDDEVCEIAGTHLLSQQRISVYAGDLEDAILPPPPAGPVVAVQPYHILFVGGVPRVHRDRRLQRRDAVTEEDPTEHDEDVALSRVKRQRIAYYVTDIPPVLGCMRGLMLGNRSINLRTDGIHPTDSDAVRSGCHNDCDLLVCHNGGHCTVHWQNYDPANREQTGCDCSKTSYYGPSCLKDTGIRFTGLSSIVFDMNDPSRRFILRESEEQTLQFAFVPASTKPKNAQRLVTLYFTNGRELQIVLNRNGSVNVGIVHPAVLEQTQVYTFDGNFTDGYRHFFQATFTIGRPTLVLVDAVKKYLDPSLRLHLADVEKFYFGGAAEESDEEAEPLEEDELFGLPIGTDLTPEFHRYRGCMSNIDIDFHKNEYVHFRPLLYYLNTKDPYHSSVYNDPPSADNLTETECAGFRIPGVLPTLQQNVLFPVWEAVFAPVAMPDPVTVEPIAVDETTPWWVWLLLIILLLLLLCCCFALCRRCCCRGSKDHHHHSPEDGGPGPVKNPRDKGINGYPDEKQPLNNDSGKGALPKIADNFELPPADEPLFRNEDESPVAHNRPIIREKPPIPPQNRAPAMPPSNPPSNKENFSDPEDPLEDGTSGEEDDEAVLIGGYDEQRPDSLVLDDSA